MRRLKQTARMTWRYWRVISTKPTKQGTSYSYLLNTLSSDIHHSGRDCKPDSMSI
jgi:hypothetical protein